MKNKKLLVLGMATIATALSVMLTNSKNANNVLADNSDVTTNEITITSNVDSYYAGSQLDWAIDGDKQSAVWFAKVFEADDYIQLNYSSPQTLNRLSFLFSTSDYYKFKVVYENTDGNWEDASDEVDASSGIVEFSSNITTTAIKLLSTGNRGAWVRLYDVFAYYKPVVTQNNFTIVPGYDINDMADFDYSTFAYFDWQYTSNSNVILDYGNSVEINNIKLASGTSNRTSDIFEKINLSYSTNGVDYESIGNYSGQDIYVELANAINARYLKLTPVLEGTSRNGLVIREFNINTPKAAAPKIKIKLDGKVVDSRAGGATISYSSENPFSFETDYGANATWHFAKDDGATNLGQTLPNEPGTYTYNVSIPASDYYSATTSYYWFNLRKATSIIIKVNGEAVEGVGGAKFKANELPTFSYELGDADVTATAYYTKDEVYYSDEAPTEPGTYAYNVKVTQTDTYAEVSAYYWYEITNADKVDPEITIDTNVFEYDGNSHTPVLTPPDGVEFADIHYEYNEQIIDYTPTEPGIYSVVFTTKENDSYNSYHHWFTFQIVYTENSFLTEWHKIRADGGNDGICAFIDGKDGRLEKVLNHYNLLTAEQKESVNAKIDIDDVTIGQTLTYIASIRSWINDKVSTNVNTANNLISTINNETNSQTLIVIIAIACASLIGYFYIVEKKKKENN